MATTGSTNPEFELRGINHLALVCRDMAETIEWYGSVLGMKLVKTLELPGGRGQHFFLDMGNGVDGIAFFWFPEAPEAERGVTLQDRGGVTAIATMNHVAFDVPAEQFEEYRRRLVDKGVEVTPIINHADSLDGGHKADYDAGTDGGDVFIRSMYFRDPNGITLEFACWTRALAETDVRHAPASARTTAGA
ncbi:MAG TPA: VOC family protein [Acidimicrobiales bacterium]|nr:VOC family protein [Acidimicrobiales bacterium]